MQGCLGILAIIIFISFLISFGVKIIGAGLFVGSLATIIYYLRHREEFKKHQTSKRVAIGLALAMALSTGTALSFNADSSKENTHTQPASKTVESKETKKTESNQEVATKKEIKTLPANPTLDKLKIHFIDVGQADSILIKYSIIDIG